MSGVHFFLDELSLNNYIAANNVLTWHGDIGFGSLLFISNSINGLFVAFDSREDYELWLRLGKPVMIQESLFDI